MTTTRLRHPSPPASRAITTTDQRAAAAVFAGARVVFQPIVSVATGSLFAVEALTRFAAPALRHTEAVFDAARTAGFGPELESMCLRAALAGRDQLPPNTVVSVNLSPDGLHRLAATGQWPDELTGVIVEITEQDITNPDAFAAAVAALRERGAALAIDDVDSGYAGLLRLAEHRPDYVKLDRRIVTGVSDNQIQAAVLEALVTLAHRLGAAVIAEGVENLTELQTLDRFDVEYAQGHAIARPARTLAPIEDAVVHACRAGRQQVLRGPAVWSGTAARTRDLYAVTAALAAAADRNDLGAAVATATAELQVDLLSVLIIAGDDMLREITLTGARADATGYRLTDYPTTAASLNEGRTLEIQIDDPTGDPAEREVLHSLGYASVLLVPMMVHGRPIGVIEIADRTARGWNSADITYGQGLAAHIAPALLRLGVAS